MYIQHSDILIYGVAAFLLDITSSEVGLQREETNESQGMDS